MIASRMMVCIVATAAVELCGCATWNRSEGVQNEWRSPAFPAPETGKTTASEILKLLGPPSQIVNLSEKMVFYYMLDSVKGKALYLILYNQLHLRTRYDRAIFFFDADGVLTEYAFSLEKVDYESDE